MTLLAKKRILAEFTLGLYSLNLIYLFYLAMLTVNVFCYHWIAVVISSCGGAGGVVVR